MNADVIVIGGGAAGLFAACELSKRRCSVLVLEPNSKLGRKLRITGKGRCNVTNNCDTDELMKNVLRNPRFLYSAFNAFSPVDTVAWFENRGVPMKTERGNRVFPVSDNANDVADCMEKECKKYHTRILKDRAVEILTENGAVVGVKGVKDEYFAHSVIVATGGLSYPATGSTGDGYNFADSLGHTVTPTYPSLVPVVCNERFVCDLSGLALRNVTLSLFDTNKKNPVYSELGELTFIDYGIAGPLSLTASCYIKPELLDIKRYKLSIDLKPGLTPEKLDLRVQRDFSETPSLQFMNSLSRLLPSQIAQTVVDLSGIYPMKPCNQITKPERQKLVYLLKHFELTPIAFRPIDEAIVTRGGVSVKEISPSTMESKLVKGLYFAGEVIDCDAFTGGFNLQIAFSTAYLAANAIADSIDFERIYN